MVSVDMEVSSDRSGSKSPQMDLAPGRKSYRQYGLQPSVDPLASDGIQFAAFLLGRSNFSNNALFVLFSQSLTDRYRRRSFKNQ